MSDGDLILFRSQDGKAEVQLRVAGETVWLSQAEIAQLFDNKPQATTMLIKAIYEDGELDSTATCKESLQVRQEGSRQVTRTIKLYSLPMILTIGYRVRSPRGTEFRQWATRHLNEYLIDSKDALLLLGLLFNSKYFSIIRRVLSM